MQLRLMWGAFSIVNDITLLLMVFTRMSLDCKLVPVHYREYEYGIFGSFPEKERTVDLHSDSACWLLISRELKF